MVSDINILTAKASAANSKITEKHDVNSVLKILESVSDPEIPVVTISDMGILRAVNKVEDCFEIIITPTYSGCPAMMEIEQNIIVALRENGIMNAKVKTVLSPAWTTEWMTEIGKEKLKSYGIAPPNPSKPNEIACPQCDSINTSLLSEFGSTACKSLYKCNECLEPFDHFKCH